MTKTNMSAIKVEDKEPVTEVADQAPSSGYRDLSSETEQGQVLDESFPVKLHYMLADIERDGRDHIVSWHVHGRCFSVRRQHLFVEQIMPCYFRQSKFASYQRQLNLYGFRRITSGPDKGAYYHECFLRGKPFLATRIHRQRIKGNGARKPAAPEQEPDFYSMKSLPPCDMKKYKTAPAAKMEGTMQGAAANSSSPQAVSSMELLRSSSDQLKRNQLELSAAFRLGNNTMLGGGGATRATRGALSMLQMTAPKMPDFSSLSGGSMIPHTPLSAAMVAQLSATRFAQDIPSTTSLPFSRHSAMAGRHLFGVGPSNLGIGSTNYSNQTLESLTTNRIRQIMQQNLELTRPSRFTQTHSLFRG